jgi:hypothetical protein
MPRRRRVSLADATLGDIEALEEARDAGKALSKAETELLAEAHNLIDQALHPLRRLFNNEHVLNFFAGLESHDPNQRRGFEALEKQITDVPIHESIPFLQLFERAKKRLGRRAGSGIFDAHLLRKMKAALALEPALSIPEAARRFADEASGGGTPESKAKRLDRKYREGVF